MKKYSYIKLKYRDDYSAWTFEKPVPDIMDDEPYKDLFGEDYVKQHNVDERNKVFLFKDLHTGNAFHRGMSAAIDLFSFAEQVVNSEA